MKKTLNDTIAQVAEDCGLTRVYARMTGGQGEANILLDEIRTYPILVQAFVSSITPSAKTGMVSRTISLYFCDDVGDIDPDTMTQVAPVCEKMEKKFHDFLAGMRRQGVQVHYTFAYESLSRFDANEAGIYSEVTFTYQYCGK